MEAFSLLKYWRAGGTIVGLPPSTTDSTTTTVNTTTILTTADTTTSSDDDDDNNEDEGPFFDLEFTAPEEEEDNVSEETNHNNQQQQEENDEENEEEESEEDGEFKITLSPSNNERSDANLSLSPSQDLFFKGKLVQFKPSFIFNNNTSEPNSKPQFTASLLKSATKFRVFMSGLKKPKPDSVTEKKQQKPDRNRIKFKVEEVPIVSLFTRDNSSKGNNNINNKKQNTTEHHEPLSPLEEKRFSKDVVMHKYLKMVKPLYIRVSRRYSHGEKSSEKVEAEIATEGETVAESEENSAKSQSQKQGNIPAGLRVVYKHLGKSRSASSAVAASPPALVSSKRRDDSLLQQQDGIQGAILHCKRSFNASRECDESSSQLPRSVSDPLREMSPELSRKSSDKRLSG
ncbi:probable membrane-associated kinase regulator 2 [Trifolium pratense]|uniref:probable membrane-associated kinase regulator 2 n=1 Tax=Trifolium pratense TaxID=57577 RepID=UPI001E696C3E|nr:probable membrane-associated kinase regulator 2 [Trifolium pratense]